MDRMPRCSIRCSLKLPRQYSTTTGKISTLLLSRNLGPHQPTDQKGRPKALPITGDDPRAPHYYQLISRPQVLNNLSDLPLPKAVGPDANSTMDSDSESDSDLDEVENEDVRYPLIGSEDEEDKLYDTVVALYTVVLLHASWHEMIAFWHVLVLAGEGIYNVFQKVFRLI